MKIPKKNSESYVGKFSDLTSSCIANRIKCVINPVIKLEGPCQKRDHVMNSCLESSENSCMKTSRVELNPCPSVHESFSCGNFRNFLNESSNFDRNFYSKMPFRGQPLPSFTRKMWVEGIFGTFDMTTNINDFLHVAGWWTRCVRWRIHAESLARSAASERENFAG